jgi:mitogen-activated protein kinase organizer 1
MRGLFVESTSKGDIPCTRASSLRGHVGPVQALCFTADGKYCLTGGVDRTIRLINPYYRKDVASATQGGALKSANDIPDALPIQIYDDLHAYPVTSLAVDHESTKIVSTSEKSLVVADIITGKVMQRLRSRNNEGRINCVSTTKDATLYVTGSYDSTVKIWDGRSNSRDPMQVLDQAKDSISCVSINGEKSEVIASSIDGYLRIYDIRAGQVRVDHCMESITSFSETHDGQSVVVSCMDGQLRLVDKSSGNILQSYHSSTYHTAGTYGLQCQITGDDNMIVSGSENGNVILYDIVSGAVRQVLEGPIKATCTIASHPLAEHSSVFVSASYDGSVVLWASDQEIEGWSR